MSTTTGIEWTDATWNPIRGCSRVSEGCRNCYAEKVAYRFSGPGQPYEGLVQVDSYGKRKPKWNGQIKFVEEHLLDPLKWRAPKRIFVNSMSDLFHENVTDAMLDRIFAVMALSPQHTFQVLTKRPERMREYFWPDKGFPIKIMERIEGMLSASRICRSGRVTESMANAACDVFRASRGILPNVWLGVSVENQKAADERIPLLLQTPAAVRFLSVEPLLGPVDLGLLAVGGHPWATHPCHIDGLSVRFDGLPGIGWVIVGGESGPGARPMHPDWARGLRDQCAAAGAPFFFKQWGEWSHADYKKPSGTPGRYALMPQDATTGMYETTFTELDQYPRQFTSFGSIVRERVGKKAAGRRLDGREWNEFPEAARG